MKIKPLAEVLGFYGATLLAIWGGQRLGLRGQVWVGAVLLWGAAALSARFHGDSRERLGLSKKNLKNATKLTVRFVGPVLLALIVVALRHPAPPPLKIVFGLLGYPVWALAQEYALLSFAANRLEDALGSRVGWVSLSNALLFSLVHAPNPLLMTACFLSGAVFTWIFLKTRQIFPLALSHAMGGFLLSWIYLDQYNAMMVGPAYWKWMGVLGPHP
jgi:hypothetical protein